MAVQRETDAFELALRALRAHDRTTAELDARLQRRGVPQEEREHVLGRLARLGYLEDGRAAQARAQQLAARGSGDALIRDDLEHRGIEPALIEEALAALEPEGERARRIVSERGPSAKTARYLASRGFGEDAVGELIAPEG